MYFRRGAALLGLLLRRDALGFWAVGLWVGLGPAARAPASLGGITAGCPAIPPREQRDGNKAGGQEDKRQCLHGCRRPSVEILVIGRRCRCVGFRWLTGCPLRLRAVVPCQESSDHHDQ